MDFLTYDFGYMWPITRGHFFVFLAFGAVAAVCVWRGWPRWITVLTTGVAVWGLAGALIMHYAIEINVPMSMPTERFLASGARNIVDLGAGSGRATLMVLLSRPQTVVTGLDRYTGFYGIVDNSPDRLRANARLAGVDGRLRVQLGDMRELPFKDGEFDGALSVAAMDHLSRNDIPRALAETARILKPGGEFLFVTINSDFWVKLALPMALHGHGYWSWKANAALWADRMKTAGLQVVEVGTQPATLYVMARKPALATSR
jgi:SAM-dependent methyltransferase